MDLFVINRYTDDIKEENVDRETINLNKLKQKIEERKKSFAIKQTPLEITLQPAKIEQNEEDEKPNLPESDSDQTNKTRANENVKVEKEKTGSEFKVLGTNEFQQKVMVKRILPHWLSHPNTVSTNLQNLKCKVEEQEWLHSTLKATLISEGVQNLFPVQEQVIPFILTEHKLPSPFWPHDVCVSAPTGSGKTLSFVLPIIQILMNQIGHHVRALIVLPVQELATQVAKVFKKYAARTSLKVVLLSGSIPLHKEQKSILRYTETLGWISEVDIIVCTAGHLVEHIRNSEGFSLKHLKFLVIDEADRIMDHIQNDWLYHLDRCIKSENELMTGTGHVSSWKHLNRSNAPPHKLLFSATLSQDPEKLEQWSLFQPKLFSAAPKSVFENDKQTKKYTTPNELNEQFVICKAEEKPLILYHFLAEKKWNRVLCFTNAAQSAHRLALLLNFWSNGTIKVAELSAALNRVTREAVLKKFNQAEINVLIATDALARGIDIPECEYVISYDPPRNIKTYIHRVGRTGRAGRSGSAITMLLQSQVNIFKDTLQIEGKGKLPQIDISGEIFDRLSDSYEKAIDATKNAIYEETKSQVKKSVALKRPPKRGNKRFGKQDSNGPKRLKQ